jgi:Domain of unknown function (DUF4382)
MSDWWKKIRAILTQGVFATVASQCGGDDGAIFVPDNSDATINISLTTDAPPDFASQVSIEFSAIELTPSSGDKITISLSPSRVVDNLSSLNDGATAALASNQTIDAGSYTAIRFLTTMPSSGTTNSFVDESDGNRFPLVLDNDDDDDGFTITQSFTVDEDGRLDLVANLDLRKSIPPRSGASYRFVPAARVVDNSAVGTITGTIDTDLVDDANCTPFIYVFSGSTVTPDDMDTDTGDPITSVPVKLNVSQARYSYRASFLGAGDYTVALTCDGSLDDPETDDTLVFLQSGNATVTANQTITLDFTT